MNKYTLNVLLFTLIAISTNLLAQQGKPTLDYYLPQDISYDENIPKPQDILGWVPGSWHVSHDQLVSYMHVMANSSPRITLENRGQTFEGRPLLLLTITTPENHSKLEEIRKQHVSLAASGSDGLDTESMPLITYQGMSIHGNEPSGANAGLLVAYYLAAAQGPEIEALLKNTVILFDPSYNPDGLQRFSYWANTNKNQNINPDPQDREYNEVWPGGRTNHYWFDMNRDWLPVQLPESRARIKTFHDWYPNILTDHHEMGGNSSFFFQPGIPSRTHPLTPQINQQLTMEIGNYHARAFDKLGSLYYTGEDYDDFYYGKGSTFPDINGSIGILFEQASSRGHAQETDNGILTFPFTIRNQFTAFLSTLEAGKNMRVKLLDYQRDFFNTTRKNAGSDAYIFGSSNDPASAYHLAEILKRHKIDLYSLARDFTQNGKKFETASSYVVLKNQKHSLLLKAMFEKRTSFTDSLFYDISAWSFPLAFNLDFSDSAPVSLAGNEITDLQFPSIPQVEKSTYAYLIPWGGYYAPKVLNVLLEKGLRIKVSMGTFSYKDRTFDYGTLVVPVKNQNLSPEEIHELLKAASREAHTEIVAIPTGLTAGINLGSRQMRALAPAKVAVIVGDGVAPYDAGEIWHLLDTRYDMKVTKLDVKNIGAADLSKYTDIILPNSSGNALNVEKLKAWVLNGGSLIAFRNSARWLNTNGLMKLDFVKTKNPAQNITFEQKGDFNGAQVIGGAIFEAKIDRSHPVNFGYKDDHLNLFRNTTLFIKADSTSYHNPIRYTDNPLASGYISEINLEALKGTRPFVHKNLGKGNVILFTDNTNFRAFWYGTNKLMMNAIFFGDEM